MAATLQLLEHDAVAVQAAGLPDSERARLALEIREQGARVRTLAEGQPLRVRQLALDVEQQTARLVAAIGRQDPAALRRESGELATQLAGLRAVVSPTVEP